MTHLETKTKIKELLTQYTGVATDIDKIETARKEAIDTIDIPIEFKAMLDLISKETKNINFEFDTKGKITKEKLTATIDHIKALTIQHGESVKGDSFQAVFVKGSETWNKNKLEGFALAHPALLDIKEVGDPSARISVVKKKKEK